MTARPQTEAAALALALDWGYADLSEATTWADAQILAAEVPDALLIDVALARTPGEAASLLRALSEGANRWQALAVFLRRFDTLTTMSPAEASALARDLYMLAAYEDPPAAFRPFVTHWDAIDLARDDVCGDLDTCIRAFLDDIHHVAAAYAG
ncbi:hypothetical protein [Sagittula sp. S175]|uniref:hypothetical protein n=1 Tax=Sagittula sp. S175 TaxID=3415129 RepID=UPI003C7C6391